MRPYSIAPKPTPRIRVAGRRHERTASRRVSRQRLDVRGGGGFDGVLHAGGVYPGGEAIASAVAGASGRAVGADGQLSWLGRVGSSMSSSATGED